MNIIFSLLAIIIATHILILFVKMITARSKSNEVVKAKNSIIYNLQSSVFLIFYIIFLIHILNNASSRIIGFYFIVSIILFISFLYSLLILQKKFQIKIRYFFIQLSIAIVILIVFYLTGVISMASFY